VQIDFSKSQIAILDGASGAGVCAFNCLSLVRRGEIQLVWAKSGQAQGKKKLKL
jgi:hypothetical protein